MCGVLGLFQTEPANTDLVEGLLTLQHRGQDSAGILTSDITFHLKKGNGTVGNVFNKKNLGRLTGHTGIGHVLYPTIGPGSDEDAQPFYVNSPFGIAMVHNGNITNYFTLRQELVNQDFRQLTSFSDVEPILNVFARELEKTKPRRFSPESVFHAVEGTFKRVKGSYSVIAIIQGKGMLGFRDAHGIKPLAFARRGRKFAFASESVTFDRLGFRRFRDVAPGEAIFVDNHRRVYSRQIRPSKPRPCIFEYVYFARPDSILDGIEVYEARLRLGKNLGLELLRQGIKPDVVVPIPDTARAAANQLGRTIGIQLREGLIKNRYIGRTFIMPGKENRTLSVRQKLNPVRSQIKNKDILLVDDSIVRGTTSKEIVQMVREAGARKVYLAITAPPLRYPCVYGIDMMTRGEFIAKRYSIERIRKLIGADALIYQTYEGLIDAVQGKEKNRKFCTACFTGIYPTGITKRNLIRIERKRQQWMK
ncbi:amidophosphoribosyltransferase [candidate division WOR-3 bacterium JGI_Cruoil_03_51_56]|uniref:Amidophosphoribosyltransferase n=1 Tax=candidate division WOR-3 bacterium JGI_Cruoil_03_51_56 TaxID=1973747 RepID=A0A235BQL5_UNCW3|nr:MAG: amidophosphoribosyltransferase [candidate division WOR-3 bacterium JGI_Cruoil_03_51_56]